MSGINSNGKKIYQLTSASALKDTDLFVISSADNLTRSITLSQLKLAVTRDFHNKDEMTELLDTIREQIKDINNAVVNSDNITYDFRTYFTNLVQNTENTFVTEINNVRNEFNTTINETTENISGDISHLTETFNEELIDIRNSLNTTNNTITDVNNSLSQRISDLDVKLTNQINGLISYGKDVPTTLATGKIYLQYF